MSNMLRVGQFVLFVLLLCHAVFSEEYNYTEADNSMYYICYQNFEQCQSIEPETFSPFVEGKVFPVFTQQTIDVGCRYLEDLVYCHYNTTKMSGCETFQRSNDFNIEVLETVVHRVCKGQGRQDIESFLTCANKIEVQVEFLMNFHQMEGFVRASRNCGVDERILLSICSQLSWKIDSLMHNVENLCSDEDSATFRRLLLLMSDSQDDIFFLIMPSYWQKDCNFLENLSMH